MSLFRAADVVELLALAAGCGVFFALEKLESGLVEDVPRIEEGWAGGGVVGDDLEGKLLLAEFLAANLASSAN
jgi:hypothetical protein